jgi:hypothetical protein
VTATDLSERVRATLHHRADALVVEARPFDPALPPAIDLHGPRRRTGPRPLLAAAVVLAVGLVAGAVVLALDDGGGTDPAAIEDVLGSSDVVGPMYALLRAGGRGEDLRVGVVAGVDDPAAPRVCVLVPDQPAACDGSATMAGVASVLVDGHWYVGLATTDPDVGISRGRPGPTVNPVTFSSMEWGEVDGWVLWVVAVPDDLDEVWVGTDLHHRKVLRPTG